MRTDAKKIDWPMVASGFMLVVFFAVVTIFFAGAALALILNEVVTPILETGWPILSWQQGVILFLAMRFLYLMTTIVYVRKSKNG